MQSSTNLLAAREAAEAVLRRLRLEAYGFAVEPRGDHWEIQVEYAATDGWRATTLSVQNTTLLASVEDPELRHNLARDLSRGLACAKYEPLAKERAQEAEAAGRVWAESKAETLRDTVPAVDWPDLWSDSDAGRLPIPGEEVGEGHLAELEQVASHAAHERWRDLLAEQRTLEAGEDEEHDLEALAIQLESTLKSDLPQGIGVGRAGSRVYLEDVATGMERTVSSLEEAWRAVADWQEKRTLGI